MKTKNRVKNFLLLWDNGRNRAGNWIAIRAGKCMVWWSWYIKLNLKYSQWFAYIHTPLIRFSKNNASWSFGLCFGKYYTEFIYHW